MLFWGIIGAVAMRGLMIGVGAQLVAQFSWILYVFGGILILTAIRMAFFTREDMDPVDRTSSSGSAADVSGHRRLSRRALLRQGGRAAKGPSG